MNSKYHEYFDMVDNVTLNRFLQVDDNFIACFIHVVNAVSIKVFKYSLFREFSSTHQRSQRFWLSQNQFRFDRVLL